MLYSVIGLSCNDYVSPFRESLVRENLDRASLKGRSGATCTATRRWNYGLHPMDAPRTEP